MKTLWEEFPLWPFGGEQSFCWTIATSYSSLLCLPEGLQAYSTLGVTGLCLQTDFFRTSTKP